MCILCYCVLYRILAFWLRLRSKCRYEAPQIITVSFIVLTLDVLYIICRPIFFNSGWYEDFFFIGLISVSYGQRCDIYTIFNTLLEYISLSSVYGPENPSIMQRMKLFLFTKIYSMFFHLHAM